MGGEFESVADIATGAVIGSAVEPDAGSGQANGADSNCLNCGTAMIGSHCHACGQKAKVHRTLHAFGHDFMHSVLHFDGKIWRTLPLLAWRPGELTRRYIHGERAKFVSPLALFLFSVFLTFAVFSLIAPSTMIEAAANKPLSAAEAQRELESDRKEIIEAIAELEAAKKEATAENVPTGWMDGEITRNREVLAELDGKTAPDVRKQVVAERKLAIQRQDGEIKIRKLEAELAKAKAAGVPTQKLEEELEGERMSIKMMTAAGEVMAKGSTEIKFDFFGLENKSLNDAAQHAIENPQLLIYKVQANTYKYSWALIPISVPFLWLLFFWRRKFKLFDHAVFVTYSLCFMMTFAMLGAVILTRSDEGSFAFVATILALIFLPPFHIYRQLRGAYQTSRFGALWRTFALSNFAMIALSVFGLMVFTLGII
jgi:hypothetical protein